MTTSMAFHHECAFHTSANVVIQFAREGFGLVVSEGLGIAGGDRRRAGGIPRRVSTASGDLVDGRGGQGCSICCV